MCDTVTDLITREHGLTCISDEIQNQTKSERNRIANGRPNETENANRRLLPPVCGIGRWKHPFDVPRFLWPEIADTQIRRTN